MVQIHEQSPPYLDQVVARKVFAVINTTIVTDEVLHHHLALVGFVVDVSVEHHDAEGEDKRRIRMCKHPLVSLVIATGEKLQYSLDLLRLSWQSEGAEEHPQSTIKLQALKLEEVDVGSEHRHVEGGVFFA
jgi:DNA-directed RNA polymerase alpha subunit